MVRDVKGDLGSVWKTTDDIFERLVTAKRALAQPIPHRHPFIFYLGHLPAFAWRQVRFNINSNSSNSSHLPHINAKYEALFERGIDPVIDDNTHSPHSDYGTTSTWPEWNSVLDFRDAVRQNILSLLLDTSHKIIISNRTLSIIIEHDAMHNETLAYMLAQLMRHIPATNININTTTPICEADKLGDEWCDVPGDTVAVGTQVTTDDDSSSRLFVWDNEQGIESYYEVQGLRVRKYPVTNREYALFIADNAYDEEKYWDKLDWFWVKKHTIQFPASFCSTSTLGRWHVCTPHGYVDLDTVAANWPVFVSLAESKAYIKWANNRNGSAWRLPTEAEWTLYSRGSISNNNNSNNSVYGCPHDVRCGSRSEFGVMDCIGNGWEWTATLFAPLAGFRPMKEYPEYSADFFGGNHNVLKGASYATWNGMHRSSFRNFFQTRYPFVFAQFRPVM